MNAFQDAKSVTELNVDYDYLTSPENLYADGELTNAQANARLARYDRDYVVRHRELTGALSDFAPHL